MTTKLFTTLTLALALILTSFNSSAQTSSESGYLFNIPLNSTMWNIEAGNFGKVFTSISKAGGTTWSSRSFVLKDSGDAFETGLLGADLNATIMSNSSVECQISKVVINMSYADKKYTNLNFDLIRSIVLSVADNSDFSNAVDITKDNTNTYFSALLNSLEFDIENPQPNQFYRLVVNIDKGINNWFYLNDILFYGEEDNEEKNLSMPQIITSTTSGGGNQYTVSVPEGELHLLASDFSYEDEQYVFQGNVYPSTSGDIAHTETEDENWRSTVPSSNSKQLSLSANVNSSVFTKIRAKAVSGDSQSPELVTWIHQTGIATSIEEIKVTETEDNNTTWYNLQGQPTANPASGLYIRVRNGKAEKVML